MSNDLPEIAQLFQDIRHLIDGAKQRAAIAINAEITLLYWQIGHLIRTEILNSQRAEYGKPSILNCQSTPLCFSFRAFAQL